MFYPKAALLLGLLALLGAETYSLPAELTGQQVVQNDFEDGELALSIIVNQMAILKILNESSTFGSLGTRRKTYEKYDIGVTQPQALAACKELGGRLALPTNKEEDDQITKKIGISFPNWEDTWKVAYWISPTDRQQEGNWIDSVTNEPLTYFNFYPGEPNNYGNGEDCVHMTPSVRGWSDRSCEHVATGYVCEFTNE